MDNPPAEIAHIIGCRFRDYVITEYIGSGYIGHVFKGYSAAINQTVACKFVPAEYLIKNDDGTPVWQQEARKPNGLNNHAVVKCYDLLLELVRNSETGVEKEYAIFLYEYIQGISLQKYIELHKGKISISFVEEFLRTTLALLWEMEGRAITHGDLHSGNIIVADPDPFDLDEKESFKVTDFGVTVVSGRGDHNDRLMIANILRDLLENTERPSDSRNRYVYEVFRRDFLQKYLLETNPLAAPVYANTKHMLEMLREIDTDYAKQKRNESSIRSLVTPFDFPSCEQMGNSHLLLKALYSDRFLGIRQIEAISNLVLTGPRGCGKTTVFRALSLDYRMDVEQDSQDAVKYIGVYYRCDDLYFIFPRFRRIANERATNVPMHYLVATLLESLLKTIKQWSEKHFKHDFLVAEPKLSSNIWHMLGAERPREPGSEKFESLMEYLRHERTRAADAAQHIWDETYEIGRMFGPEVLIKIGEYLRGNVVFLADRPIYFFIDDYSEPKITDDLQENLNRLLVHRSGDIYFKISTESPVSFVPRDLDGKSFVEGREYELLNLGIEYIRDDRGAKLKFLQDLFDRRFKEVMDYPVKSLSDLLGDSERNENKIARGIRSKNKEPYNFGRQTLASLFSGDIHYMIRLVGKMVDAAGGVDVIRDISSVPLIDARRQHDTIRIAAGEFLDSVRRLPKYGERLADIISAFGNVAYSYLLHRNSKNETGAPPHQASRIEPYSALHLDGEAKEIYKELLRYSIFLEDPRGKSRRGEVVPRLYLRRYLIPHFNLTFSRRDSIEVENSDFEKLLLYPQAFQESKRMKSPGDTSTPDMFSCVEE